MIKVTVCIAMIMTHPSVIVHLSDRQSVYLFVFIALLPLFLAFSHFRYTASIDESLLTIDFISPTEPRVFVNRRVHYLREGLFAVRYRLHREVSSLSISVKYDNHDIGDSPYFIGKRERNIEY